MPLEGYYTTTEAARELGIKPASLRGAVMRGRIRVERLGDRNLVPVAELERYRAEVSGTRGWSERKEAAHMPNRDAAIRQRAYRERKKAAD
jgi:excisionase family DNA binding protein